MNRRQFLLLTGSAAALLHLGCSTADEIDVKDLGAAGDGLSDDSEAIETAMRLSSDVPGRAVVLPPGTYVVRRTLEVQGEVILRGRGVERTLILFEGPAVQMATAGETVLTLERVRVAGGEPFAA